MKKYLWGFFEFILSALAAAILCKGFLYVLPYLLTWIDH